MGGLCIRTWSDGSFNRLTVAAAVENLSRNMVMESWKICERYGGRDAGWIKAALLAGETLETPLATFKLEAPDA